MILFIDRTASRTRWSSLPDVCPVTRKKVLKVPGRSGCLFIETASLYVLVSVMKMAREFDPVDDPLDTSDLTAVAFFMRNELGSDLEGGGANILFGFLVLRWIFTSAVLELELQSLVVVFESREHVEFQNRSEHKVVPELQYHPRPNPRANPSTKYGGTTALVSQSGSGIAAGF